MVTFFRLPWWCFSAKEKKNLGLRWSLNVQHAMGLSWANHKTGGLGGGHAARQVAPTLDAIPLRHGAIPAALLASGSFSAAILSEHGNRLETLVFPV